MDRRSGSQGDPSLRLKNGSAQDDAELNGYADSKLSHCAKSFKTENR